MKKRLVVVALIAVACSSVFAFPVISEGTGSALTNEGWEDYSPQPTFEMQILARTSLDKAICFTTTKSISIGFQGHLQIPDGGGMMPNTPAWKLTNRYREMLSGGFFWRKTMFAGTVTHGAPVG
jgi:hypothetical protein